MKFLKTIKNELSGTSSAGDFFFIAFNLILVI